MDIGKTAYLESNAIHYHPQVQHASIWRLGHIVGVAGFSALYPGSGPAVRFLQGADVGNVGRERHIGRRGNRQGPEPGVQETG